MKKPSKKPGLRPKLQKTKAKLAATLNGKPAKNLKIIAVTGNTGKETVAHFVHKILLAHNIPAALITSPVEDPLSTFTLHGYLSKALRSGATHVVVEAPAAILKKNTFHQVPIHMAILTNTAPPESISSGATDTITHKSTIFQNSPHFIVLNRDDPHYDHFADFAAEGASASFGRHKDADAHINRSKIFKKGTEAGLSLNSATFDIATFVVGEEAVAYMAAAAAAAALLDIPHHTIVDGIASYEP